jgi:hypothetical protein
MGFRQAAVLASVSFFTGKVCREPRLRTSSDKHCAGILFICLTVDYRILWALDDQAVQDGMVFYSTFYNAPVVIRVRHWHYALDVSFRNSLSEPAPWHDGFGCSEPRVEAAQMVGSGHVFRRDIPRYVVSGLSVVPTLTHLRVRRAVRFRHRHLPILHHPLDSDGCAARPGRGQSLRPSPGPPAYLCRQHHQPRYLRVHPDPPGPPRFLPAADLRTDIIQAGQEYANRLDIKTRAAFAAEQQRAAAAAPVSAEKKTQ